MQHLPWSDVEAICRSRATPLLPKETGRVSQDDLIQAGLAAAWTLFDSDDAGLTLPAGATRGYLSQVVRNAMVDTLRAARTDHRTTEGSYEHLSAADDELVDGDGYDPFSARNDIAAMRDALSRLPEREAFIVAATAHGYTGTEIARHLSITGGRVSQLLASARTKLRQDFSDTKRKIAA